MAPIKETLEVTTNDTAVSQAHSRSKPAGMRADAVSLEVPVKVHGTRVSQAASGIASSEPFEEKTTTIIVFPQGGVLKMSTPVAPAQMMVVTNLKSGQDAICRVIKIRAFAAGQSYVEIEFTHRKAAYWGVYFPSDRVEATEQAAPANQPVSAPPISVDVKVERPADKSVKERAATKPATTAKKPDSVFAPIGSQEPIQPAAASTSSRMTPSAMGSIVESAAKGPNLDVPAAATSSAPSSSSLRENRTSSEPNRDISFAGAGVPGEVVDAPEDEEAEQTPSLPAPPGPFSASLSLDDEQAATGDAFGSGLGSSRFGSESAFSASSRAKSSNGTILAVAAVVILAFAAGVAYRFHFFSGHRSTAQSDSTMPSTAPPAPPMAADPLGNLALNGATQPPNSAMAASAPHATSALSARANALAPVISSRSVNPSSPATPAEASVAPPEKAELKTPNLVAALKTHPRARKHARADAAAPDIDDAPVDSNAALPAIAGSLTIAPPPGAAQAPVRIRVGGLIKPPQLVSSVMPAYPAMARETGIDGDVVIDTTIDKTGKVTSTKVISGPSMLREAALDALRQWKYQPSLLNGDPVPVQMTVTIKFHRN